MSYRLNPRNLSPRILPLCRECRERLGFTLMDYAHVPGLRHVGK